MSPHVAARLYIHRRKTCCGDATRCAQAMRKGAAHGARDECPPRPKEAHCGGAAEPWPPALPPPRLTPKRAWLREDATKLVDTARVDKSVRPRIRMGVDGAVKSAHMRTQACGDSVVQAKVIAAAASFSSFSLCSLLSARIVASECATIASKRTLPTTAVCVDGASPTAAHTITGDTAVSKSMIRLTSAGGRCFAAMTSIANATGATMSAIAASATAAAASVGSAREGSSAHAAKPTQPTQKLSAPERMFATTIDAPSSASSDGDAEIAASAARQLVKWMARKAGTERATTSPSKRERFPDCALSMTMASTHVPHTLAAIHVRQGSGGS
mmetsp:Transcript_979/g.3676  ORF Transcript_979/g.3676 Transcript_979/m.3676 type:complete len:329 (-) Transcript_979:426-1412(-)